MIGKDEIARAISDADALAEEHQDLPAYWRKRNVDIGGLGYVAMQRGLRAVMMFRGESPNTLGQQKQVRLNPGEERLQMAFAAAFMDGFAARDSIKDEPPSTSVYAIVRGWQDFDGPEADIFSTREAAEEQLERLGGEGENTSRVQEQLIYNEPFADEREEDE